MQEIKKIIFLLNKGMSELPYVKISSVEPSKTYLKFKDLLPLIMWCGQNALKLKLILKNTCAEARVLLLQFFHSFFLLSREERYLDEIYRVTIRIQLVHKVVLTDQNKGSIY